ncbi:hypothetical protein GOB94_14005 [Granulicella sp. 5B5]|uniref:hypothetical protein n=1 Tax=Granulicella sp. 5B5 TaxID=1617967 RepID=UPI0015F69E39|nr:hypothetical protein [Granulicella sp. 5B5]QMV19679.1 hypothetical protein GOB94_14005 [Granulicella sp. 5B5]
MVIDMNEIHCSPKTTLLGLGLFLSMANQSVKFDVAGHLAMTQRDWFGFVVAVGLGLVGLFSKDADSK